VEKQTFSGKVALVTGGANGIGKAIATQFAKQGAMVAILDVFLDVAKETAKGIASDNQEVEAFACDITNTRQVNRVIKQVYERFGGIDILVNNAGIGDTSTPIENMTDEQWERMLNVHLSGTFKMTRAVVPYIKERGSGRIINMSSQTGMVGEADFCHYSAAKAGLLGLTKALAKELAEFHISVNAIAPGVIETTYFKKFTEEQMAKKRAVVPWGRLGKPEDIAYVAAFLASEEAEYITGQVISPNGGRTIVGI